QMTTPPAAPPASSAVSKLRSSLSSLHSAAHPPAQPSTPSMPVPRQTAHPSERSAQRQTRSLLKKGSPQSAHHDPPGTPELAASASRQRPPQAQAPLPALRAERSPSAVAEPAVYVPHPSPLAPTSPPCVPCPAPATGSQYSRRP